MKLGAIADIQSGYHFRGSIAPDAAGEYRVIQVRDVDAYGRLNASGLTRVSPDRPADQYLVRDGDVLFLARGIRQYAIPVVGPMDQTLAPNHFFIIRPTQGVLKAEFLAWYINQPPVQGVLRSKAQGSNVHFVAKSDLAELDIPVPSGELQMRIVALADLAQRERELLAELAEQRTNLISGLCLQAVAQESTDDPD